MGRESAIHNDSYSSDVSDAVAPLGIYPEVGFVAAEEGLAPPAVFFDDKDCAVIPFKAGCVGVADLDGETIRTLGKFVPGQDDAEQYGLQFAYSFTDSKGRLVGPTTHGHVVIIRTRDESGTLLERFEKALDVDILSESCRHQICTEDEKRKLTLLSSVFDYVGNLWFVTGYFRLYPDRAPAGFLGYISRQYIDDILNKKPLSEKAKIHFRKLAPGEGAENGISSCKAGTVILTNKACYLFAAGDEGIVRQWHGPYDSAGARDANDSDQARNNPITGGGLAWGSGTTPTLTKDLALFTDNAEPNKLLAFSQKDGSLVASSPVLDTLGEGVRVSVENSILVYSGEPSRTSVVVCNWFGAGNPKLKSIVYPAKVSYDELYDETWVQDGNKHLYPGVERVDVVKNGNGYHAEKIWSRSDLYGTSIFKLSTATGHLYCYDQDLATGMWMFRILDFDTGKTLLEIPVSDRPKFNNMAVGVTIDTRGNALYCPTNTPNLVRLRDRFVYLPDSPERLVDLGKTGRRRLTYEEFTALSGTRDIPVSSLHGARIDGLGPREKIAYRINGIFGSPASLKAYCRNADEKLQLLPANAWELTHDGGTPVTGELHAESLYELRVRAGALPNYDAATGNVRAAVILAVTPRCSAE